MKSFKDRYLERQPVTHGVLRTIRLLGEFKGWEALFREQFPQAIDTLRQVAVIHCTESANQLEGVIAPPARE